MAFPGPVIIALNSPQVYMILYLWGIIQINLESETLLPLAASNVFLTGLWPGFPPPTTAYTGHALHASETTKSQVEWDKLCCNRAHRTKYKNSPPYGRMWN